MGDVGVACAPLQHAIERFANSEAFCSRKASLKKMRRGRDEEDRKKGEAKKSEQKPELEKGDFAELEPGELRNSELENGEFVPDLDKSELVPEKWSKYKSEKGEIVPDKVRRSFRDSERSVTGLGRIHEANRRKGHKDNRDRDREHMNERHVKSSSRGPEQAELGELDHHVHNNGKSSWSKWHRESSRGNFPERPCKGASYSSSSRSTPSSWSSRGSHERPSLDRGRHEDHREHSPGHAGRSLLERARHRDYRDHRSSSHSQRSPHSRTRLHGHRDRSPHDRCRAVDHRDQSRRSAGSDKPQNSCNEDRLGLKDSTGKDFHKNDPLRKSDSVDNNVKPNDRESQNFVKEPSEPRQPSPPPPSLPPLPIPPQPQANGSIEEPSSMEEDMDICDTPPHAPILAELNLGKWYYLDHFGVERGPSKLNDLQRLVEDRVLLSDHLIKHSDSDWWVTVENATSPVVRLNLPPIVSDDVTQLVSPPEASGNSLVDIDVSQNSSEQLVCCDAYSEAGLTSLEASEDLQIDERVGALLDGYLIIHGKELESLGEALSANFVHMDIENLVQPEDFSRSRPYVNDSAILSREDKSGQADEGFLKEVPELGFAPFVKDSQLMGGFSDWFAGRWSCMGGDWKRNDEPTQDRYYKRRFVLNEGYPLCLMPKNGYEDPRLRRRDDLYHSSRPRKLDLPLWAFTWAEDSNDVVNENSRATSASTFGQIKPLLPRGVNGTMLPVIRINACVVKDQGSSDQRLKVRSGDRHLGKLPKSNLSGGTIFSFEGSSRSKKNDSDLRSLHRCRNVSIPRDHVCTVDELSVQFGDWYYLDGTGHQRGPSSYAELQDLAAKGTIPMHSSVFRKDDNVWLPIGSNIRVDTVHMDDKGVSDLGPSADCVSFATNGVTSASESFHISHPQFIGYARGKLHELVLKSYKNREFAAAINEVLDPWISTKQQKKDLDKHFPFNSSITRSSSVLVHELSGERLWKSDDGSGTCYQPAKRARLFSGESDGDSEEEELSTCQRFDCSFDDLCVETGLAENAEHPQSESDCWGLLGIHILARIFHLLRKDMKALAFAGATCKRWKAAACFYRSISKHVDFSSFGLNCSDSMFCSIMSGYSKNNIKSVILAGCSNISSSQLEDTLRLFPFISVVDMRGCSHFRDLIPKYQTITWVKSSRPKHEGSGESSSKIRSIRQITEKTYPAFKDYYGVDSHLDDFNGRGAFANHESYMDRKDSSNHFFQQGYYRGKRLIDSRKSSQALSRQAQMRQLVLKREYRKMEEFISSSLKEIMRERTIDYFIPKVARIENRIRSGFYFRNGLGSVKEDIRRLCRDALKVRNRGDVQDMNQIMLSFIHLLKSLDVKSKSHRQRNEIRSLKDDPDSGVSSSFRLGRKKSKALSEKKGTSHAVDVEREIRRSLSKLRRRNMCSETESSDDLSEDFKYRSETTDSETESDTDSYPGAAVGEARGAGYFLVADSFDSTYDDQDWGARMTKESLVPPVTRKYEVIDRYLIVADEEDVRRKMQVALPENFEEKLLLQKNSKDESDMQLPQVKEYKPRKALGEEVIEQEVYGIEPYTYNLILSSMPNELGWPSSDKSKFIEEVLLHTLNKQVRRFTGTGNAPMEYHLEPVIREIQQMAEEEGEIHLLQMCKALLKAIKYRADKKYVAYRKGLGVVCNREEGFSKDDFVVEFLGEVYPAWKWAEKEDGIKSLKDNNEDPTAEFYNIYLERPKGDRDGYDLVVVDAMHKANYASRICHSCRPNCEAKVTAVDGKYQIGIYTIRPIANGEEITFDYNTLTDSKEELEKSICLCGTHLCKGSYLSYNGEGAFQTVLKNWHGILQRHKLMLEACETIHVSQEDCDDLARAGLGACLLSGLPDWLVAYTARLVRFINFERTKLPEIILEHNLEEKRKFVANICLEDERSEAEIQAEGVHTTRLQTMVITLDKVRYVMRCVFGDAKKAPPPLQKLSPESIVYALWKGDDSLIAELLRCMAPHVEVDVLNELKSKIDSHDPLKYGDLRIGLRQSLLWLRDELRNLPCTHNCRHDAAADLIHLYAYTRCFFRVQEYKSVISPPVYISPLDLGPKYADKIASGFYEYCKKYSESYCLGQLMYWHCQETEPDNRMGRSRKGCLSLPDVSSFYAKNQKPLDEYIYSSRTLKLMLSRMEKEPERPWPKDQIWVFQEKPKFLGSPMMDAVLNNCPLDKEMLHWLRNRPNLYHGA